METWKRLARMLLMWIMVMSWNVAAFAAVFAVENSSQFQEALDAASDNGQDDVLSVAAGVYWLEAELTFASSEDRSLTIRGAGAETTILDGRDAVRALSLTTSQEHASIRLEGLTLRNGRTAGNGGALRIATNAADIAVADCRIVESAATGGESVGGGANLNAETGTITVTACAFSGNASSGNVGGLFVGTTTGTGLIADCAFTGNSVANTGSSGAFGDGGGAMFYSQATSRATITGNRFAGNTASGGDNPDGGGLMTYQLGGGSQLHLSGNTFSENTAGLGAGGVIVRCNLSCAASVADNIFSGNTAIVGSGGGAHLYINDGSLDYAGNSHTGNRAGEDGAGAWIDMLAGTAAVSRNTFTRNIAGGNGGGLSAVTDTASIVVEKNIFNANASGNAGAGLSFATVGGTGTIRKNTTYGNSASGEAGGAYVYIDTLDGRALLTDNILWNDSPDAFGYSSGSGGVHVLMEYSDVDGGVGEAWFSTGCIAADPLFVDAPAGNFNLSWAHAPVNDATKSPCIDTGSPASAKDPDGSRSDMGALPFVHGNASVVPALSLLLLL